MASSIVKSAAEQVGTLLVEEAKFLYKVHGKIEKLQTELEWMECFLEDADNRQHKEKLVRKWVAQITDFAYEAEDIIERYLHKVTDQRRDGIWDTVKWFSNILCTCHVKTLHNLGLDIDELIDEVSELNKRLKRYGIQFMSPVESLAYDAMRGDARRTYSHVEEEVVGLENDVKQVEDQLMKRQVNVVSISGMGGLGKSTLARKVFVDKTITQHFRNNCVWVCISKNFSPRNVFEEILVGLSVSSTDEDARKKIKELTEEELPKKIYELLQNKACFVVLDDIWNTEAWHSLEPALGSIKRSPSKILLTTRNQSLLQYIDSNGYSHPLEPLNDEKSWELLQRKAFPQRSTVESSFSTQNQMDQDEIEVTTEKEKLGKEMLKHCHGLPLAIITLGGILSRKRKADEWKEVLKNISAYLMAGDGNKDGGILRVLELSYYDLPFYLKPCFLYLANFPEDYEISAERLYHLWEAEGILTVSIKVDSQAQDISTTFDLGERYLNELIQRSMVKVGRRWARSGRIKTCGVHDLIRDVCIRKCKEVSFLNVQEYSNFNMQSIVADCYDIRKRVHRCAIHVREGIVESHLSAQHQRKAPYVRSLLIFLLNKSSDEVGFEKKELANMVNCFSLLRVLDLEDIGFNTEEWKSVHLIHLRYLSLQNMGIERFPSCFWGQKYLVTLDLRTRRSSMKLPNKFHHMERLRHLYLPEQFLIIDGDRLNFRTHQMETLKNFNPEKCDIKDLSQMTSLLIFSITRFYEFKSVDDLKALAEMSAFKSRHQLVNTLRLGIKASVIEEDPSVLTSLFNSDMLTSLVLIKWNTEVVFHNVDNAIERGIQVFPNSLIKLHMEICEVGKQVRLALEKLPHLQRLLLHFSKNKKLIFSDGSFLHLKLLVLYHAYELEEWEIGKEALPTLQRLVVDGCQKLAKLPDGLPDSVDIECKHPCIRGIEKYNTCPHFTGNFEL